jgi:hypothetical protein
MPPLPLFLIVAGFVLIGLSTLFARMAWPRFRSLERRGLLKTPVSDIESTGNTNSLRTFGLLWFTPIPADRPQLKRLVLAYRACQIIGALLMFGAAVTLGTLGGDSTPSVRERQAPPPITLIVQDH